MTETTKSKGKIAATWAVISAVVAALALFLTNVEKIIQVTKSLIYGDSATHGEPPLRVDCEVWPQTAKPGEVVTLTVTPVARNAIIIPHASVVIQNFSAINDDTVGSWVPETRGRTDANGVFRLQFRVPASNHWKNTRFDVYVTKEGYSLGHTEVSVSRRE